MPAHAGDDFSVGDAFGWGWNKFTQNVGPILLAVLVYLVILLVIEAIAWFVLRGALISDPSVSLNQATGQVTVNGGSGFFASMLVNGGLNFFFVVVFAFMEAGVIRGALMLANGQRLEVGHMFNFNNFGTILVAAILVGIGSFIGFFLCFVGAIVVWLFTAFYLFFIIDKQQGAWESIMSSVNLVASHFGKVVLLLLACIAAYIVGAILCGIGLLVTAPVALLALTYGYRRLQGDPIAA
jgi:uncharacterized membrane protein